MFDENLAGPEEINITAFARNPLDRLFKARYGAAADAENIEKLVPEGLLFRAFAFGVRPFL
ncbi:MAG: hypothetical protein WA405_12770 [Candidatus Acidiferrales bacterium]